MVLASPSLLVAASLVLSSAPAGLSASPTVFENPAKGVASTARTSVTEPSATSISLDFGAPSDLDAEGLPDSLVGALARDVGIDGDSYLRQADAAAAATAILPDLKAVGLGEDAIEVDADGHLIINVDTAAQEKRVRELADRLGAQTDAVPRPEPLPEPPVPPILTPMIGHLNPSLIMGPFAAARKSSKLPDAGSAYVTADWSVCTLAFWGHNSKGKSIALTAGHCDHTGRVKTTTMAGTRPFSTHGTPDKSLGRFSRSNYGRGSDFAVINAQNGKATAPARVKKWSGSSSLPIRGVVNPIVGATVCKSGATTGWTCGQIKALPREYELADVNRPRVNGFATTMCSGPGDSGAPVVSGRYAVGILSFGSYRLRDGDGPKSCDFSTQVKRFLDEMLPMYPTDQQDALRKIMKESPEQMILTGVHPLTGEDGASAFASLGSSFKLSAYVPTPTVKKAVAQKAKGTTISGKVALEGASPSDYTVKVSLGKKSMTARVKANGKFSVKVPSAKSAQKYTVTVTPNAADAADPTVRVVPARASGKTSAK
ncbi:MAG: trypsin-like serine protease [Micrococcales bacterium]|nr:trypsin-like serine protease [Micrococcales bacterium]